MRWMRGEFEMIVSPHLLEELSVVVLRPRIRRHVLPNDSQGFVELLRIVGPVKPDPPASPGLTPDPGDDYLVALARDAGAECIVSGDPHLTRLTDPEPPILTPRAFLDRMSPPA